MGVPSAADYTAWKLAFGTTVDPGTGADGNNDGVVDAADYTVWRDNLGASSGSLHAAPVPEPASIMLASGLLAILMTCRRRK